MKNGIGAFSRKAALGLALLGTAAAAPSANATMIDLDLVFPSSAILSSFPRDYAGAGVNTIGLDVNGTMWTMNLVIPNIELSGGVSFAQLIANGGAPINATYNPSTGGVTTDDFDIVVKKFQIGNGTPLWTDTIQDFSLTTGSFSNVCNNGTNTNFSGDPLDGIAPADAFLGMGDIKLVGSQCLNNFGGSGDFNDVRFTLQLFGNIPDLVTVPEPSTGMLLGLVLAALALPKRARKQ